MLARKYRNDVDVISTTGRALGALFPEIIEELADLPDIVLDAELVVPGDTGRHSFQRVKGRASRRTPKSIATGRATMPAVLCAFDVLWFDGRDVRGEPLVDRKGLIADVLPTSGTVQRLTWIEQHGTELFAAACLQGLKGVVAKHMDAPYKAGRQDCWQKIANADYVR